MQNRNVFILLGQSNMVGQGDLSEVTKISNSRIYSFNNNCWDIVQEPLHKDSQKAGIGLAMSFAEKSAQLEEKQRHKNRVKVRIDRLV